MSARVIEQRIDRREAILTLRNLHWPVRRIANAVGLSERRVWAHLSELAEAGRRIEAVRADAERLREELEVA